MATTDVWTLETSHQELASANLNNVIDRAFKFSGVSERAYLRHLWNGESWPRIKEKVMTEGSVWDVWYMDGVNHHLAHLEGIGHPGFD